MILTSRPQRRRSDSATGLWNPTPIRLHDLRHGAATFLLAAGYDMKVVQETLRLSSITIAADIYTSLLPQLVRQSAEDAAAIVLRADTPEHATHKHTPHQPRPTTPMVSRG